ncbi:hypothetical protein MSG28_008588 [Choristoneura fumiferana]|uniref:Uncharacterized protein n=1 Tax=Choristoneura fumiferana TaxID=7141 RepID=A0ACC0J7D5_CHOFU|nr:hypothetical protein MSG28_008588 [Choristoneura fumiferana]
MKNVAILLVAALACHLVVASPVPEPDPSKTHIKVHLPYNVHTIHHHHVEKVPIFHEVPVIKEVPIIKTVPIYKTVPIVNTVHVEKPVFIPIKEHSWL